MINNQINFQRISPNTTAADVFLSNPIINKLSYTDPKIYYILYFFLILYFSFYAVTHYSWSLVTLGIVTGAMIWTLVEYFMHRFAFHWDTQYTLGKIMVFMFHGVHHAYPQDVTRSITPPLFSVSLAVSFYFIFQLIFGAFYCKVVMTGFLIGYVLYTIIHDSTHHFPMNFPLAKQLKRNHMRHHYFDDCKNYGVTMPLWDYVFGTKV